MPYVWIVGSLGVALVLLILVVVIFVSLRSSGCFSETEGSAEKNLDGKISHKFHNLRNTSFCCASGRYICCKSGDWKRTSGESSDHQKNISKAIGADLFDVEKPVVFSYEEILSSTDGFSDSNLLGHGTYGSVYYGLLRDQDDGQRLLNEHKAAYAWLKANSHSVVTPLQWADALEAAIAAVSKYGGASAGYRTLLDALIPASAVLKERLSAGDDPVNAFVLSSEAALAGAESTKHMQAQAGRSAYVSGDILASVPDPGAMAAASWYRAAALAVKDKYQSS